MERWVEVVSIRFSQEQIHPFFHKCGPILDALPSIKNEVAKPAEALAADSAEAPSVRLVPPFPPIRCFQHKELNNDLISLDNRRLYALQMAAVERWPARCLARVLVAEELPWEVLQAEYRKLAEGGLGPVGPHAGKPPALMEHLCGDVQVLLASRGSAWEPWNAAKAVLERCGVEVDGMPPDPAADVLAFVCVDSIQDADMAEAALVAQGVRRKCQEALRNACDVRCRELELYSKILDAGTIAAHAAAYRELQDALEALRHAAVAASGVIVRRVGIPGDRDGYISVTAQAAALKRLGLSSG